MALSSWSKPSSDTNNPETFSAPTLNAAKAWHHNSTSSLSPAKINRTRFLGEAGQQAITEEATTFPTKNASEPTSSPGPVSRRTPAPNEAFPPAPQTVSQPKTGPPSAIKPTQSSENTEQVGNPAKSQF
ncbi:uncharacterized protein MYCFIDRAFT_210934 [Pseudocercospora fijiensis CIRAD86]|uniref:Uncharacterized protein n=1 Tax=Pseudocercospora fijiensis (strain CIRAD86) TaxID=383855 RepID=M3B5J6_PSEFD|nr:uncharacterized protein MYCFIDRAFT_210934 [Pseudocercospora fijiensis CIRAD86]EME84628.1 hypothetical protein MYCFIDRAFT_210934 [Pseudocercospora fijiensis CIRAD86]